MAQAGDGADPATTRPSCSGPMPQGPPRARDRNYALKFERPRVKPSDRATRFIAIAGFVLTTGQLVWFLFAWVAPPKVVVTAPDSVELWCGDAFPLGATETSMVACGAVGNPTGSTTALMVGALGYFNASFGRNVVIREETATLTFQPTVPTSGGATAPGPFRMRWNRIESGHEWEVTPPQNVDANHPAGHATIFFAGGAPCSGKADFDACVNSNKLYWWEFIQALNSKKYAKMSVSFDLKLLGSGWANIFFPAKVVPAPPCVIDLSKPHKEVSAAISGNAVAEKFFKAFGAQGVKLSQRGGIEDAIAAEKDPNKQEVMQDYARSAKSIQFKCEN